MPDKADGREPFDLADAAIGMFLELRDQHGRNEDQARREAVCEVMEGWDADLHRERERVQEAERELAEMTKARNHCKQQTIDVGERLIAAQKLEREWREVAEERKQRLDATTKQLRECEDALRFTDEECAKRGEQADAAEQLLREAREWLDQMCGPLQEGTMAFDFDKAIRTHLRNQDGSDGL